MTNLHLLSSWVQLSILIGVGVPDLLQQIGFHKLGRSKVGTPISSRQQASDSRQQAGGTGGPCAN